jgi:hypothetical protein
MEHKTAIPYEAPTLTTYGTVEELTLGNGNSPNVDVQPCIGPQRGTTPSQISCKTAG